MTWSLSASGHTSAPEGAENWAEVEEELHDRLRDVLSDPKFGATSSSFGGNYVSGSPHLRLPKAVEPHARTEADDGE